MSKEIENLVARSKNPEALAKIFDHAADRLDKIRREIFPPRAQTVDVQKGSENDEGGANGR